MSDEMVDTDLGVTGLRRYKVYTKAVRRQETPKQKSTFETAPLGSHVK